MKQAHAHVGTCHTCGKLCFLTRKDARMYLRKSFPGEKMSIYPCGDYYHFGHTPWGIKRGITDRRSWNRERRPVTK